MPVKTPVIGEITRYSNRLNAKQQQAVPGVVKTFAEEEPWCNDKMVTAEMDKRFKELKTGMVNLVSLQELEENARWQYKNRKRKK